jgi:alkanesulfonate monooxygenase SsuD/methylene tetrahydromethanopterin reductase-like flavin-dependent oxidoreductase (luciferase family)
MASVSFHLYLPQMRMSLDTIVERARAAEGAGFEGIGLMDHLAPPMALDQPMYEAMVTATWLAAHTTTLRIGHLVLCDAFRHPAVLAREAVSVDHASRGRFELGIGWGSVPAEMETFGVGSTEASERVGRLGETLEVIRSLWSGDPVDFSGRFHQIRAGAQRPTPLGEIPIVIGGAGPRTLELVAAYADWWNLPVYALDRLEKLRPRAGKARTSVQQMVAWVPSEEQRPDVEALVARRFPSWDGLAIGTGPELVEHFRGLRDRGVERFYVWFTDFADPATVRAFGAEVVAQVAEG